MMSVAPMGSSSCLLFMQCREGTTTDSGKPMFIYFEGLMLHLPFLPPLAGRLFGEHVLINELN
jgi:hypothetical protein